MRLFRNRIVKIHGPYELGNEFRSTAIVFEWILNTKESSVLNEPVDDAVVAHRLRFSLRRTGISQTA